MNLDELLHQLRAGAARGQGRRASERFWKEARAELQRFFYSYIQAADRDDLTQMSILIVMQKVDDYEQTGPDSFSRWLWAIGARIARAWRRLPRADRSVLSRMLRELSPTSANPESRLAILEEWERLVAVLPELSDNDREILEHDRAEGSDEDFARAHGITRAAVSMRRKRARERARRRLQGADETKSE